MQSNVGLPPNLKLSHRNWGWLLALGVLFLVLGFIALGMTISVTLVSMFFFGVLLLIGGVLQIIDVFNSREWKGGLWHGLIAILYIIAGAIVLYDPFLASIVITACLGIVLIIIGLSRFSLAFSIRDAQGWWWLVISAITACILGLMILVQWPFSGLWVIGLFIAIELIIAGWTYIFIAFAMRRH